MAVGIGRISYSLYLVHWPIIVFYQYYRFVEISAAERLGLDAGMSHSCYDPTEDGRACGLCDACRLRAKGFAEAGLPDPTVYA